MSTFALELIVLAERGITLARSIGMHMQSEEICNEGNAIGQDARRISEEIAKSDFAARHEATFALCDACGILGLSLIRLGESVGELRSADWAALATAAKFTVQTELRLLRQKIRAEKVA